MEFLFEILFEFILEGSMEICKSKTANAFLRFFAFLFLVLFFGCFFVLFTFLGIRCLRNNLAGGTFILLVELGLLLLGEIKLYHYYLKNKVKK